MVSVNIFHNYLDFKLLQNLSLLRQNINDLREVRC
jgi:hypothetical protein